MMLPRGGSQTATGVCNIDESCVGRKIGNGVCCNIDLDMASQIIFVRIAYATACFSYTINRVYIFKFVSYNHLGNN